MFARIEGGGFGGERSSGLLPDASARVFQAISRKIHRRKMTVKSNRRAARGYAWKWIPSHRPAPVQGGGEEGGWGSLNNSAKRIAADPAGRIPAKSAFSRMPSRPCRSSFWCGYSVRGAPGGQLECPGGGGASREAACSRKPTENNHHGNTQHAPGRAI